MLVQIYQSLFYIHRLVCSVTCTQVSMYRCQMAVYMVQQRALGWHDHLVTVVGLIYLYNLYFNVFTWGEDLVCLQPLALCSCTLILVV